MGDLREVGAGLANRFEVVTHLVRRTSGGPVLVRLGAAIAALVALLVALPVSISTRPAGLAGSAVLALGVALAPRSRWVTLVALAAIAAWIITTLRYADELNLWRVALLTAALYTMHTGAALAAVLPYDAIVAPGVLIRWLVRTGAVVAASLAVGVASLLLVGRLDNVSTLLAPVLGVAAVAGMTLLLAWQLRKR